MKTEEQYAADPWYKQPWLLIAMIPLVATVIAGTTFLVVSIISADGIVKDDFYRQSRGYFKDTTKTNLAYNNQVGAAISIDNVTGDVTLKLAGKLNPLPTTLRLDFVSPTHQKYDLKVILKQVADQAFYIGSLASPLSGKRYIMLTPADQTWRLSNEINPPYDQGKFNIKAEQP